MLQDFQNAYITLLCDQKARKALRETPCAWLTQFKLDTRETQALIELDPLALDRFAQSLLHKRSHELSHVIPHSLLLCPELLQIYRAWLANHPAQTTNSRLDPGTAEGLRALPALRERLKEDKRLAEYSADILTYEIFLAATRRDHITRHIRSPFPLAQIFDDLKEQLIPSTPSPTPTLFRFLYHPDTSRVLIQQKTPSPRTHKRQAPQ